MVLSVWLEMIVGLVGILHGKGFSVVHAHERMGQMGEIVRWTLLLSVFLPGIERDFFVCVRGRALCFKIGAWQ